MDTILRHLFTCSDNETWDIGRFIWASISVCYIVLSLMHVVVVRSFDYVAWATGAGIILTGGGASLVIKRSTEPGS